MKPELTAQQIEKRDESFNDLTWGAIFGVASFVVACSFDARLAIAFVLWRLSSTCIDSAHKSRKELKCELANALTELPK